MDVAIQKQLESDFESYMFKFFNEYNRFSLEDFGGFATTLLNYYVNNNIVLSLDKHEAAYFLTTLYNKGIGNRIIEKHLQEIAKSISSDYSIDFTIVQRIFS